MILSNNAFETDGLRASRPAPPARRSTYCWADSMRLEQA